MVRLDESLQNGRYITGLLPGCTSAGNTDTAVSGLSIDSREKQENALFIPLKGERVDGHDFIKDAYRNGARTFFIGAEHHDSVPVLASSLHDALFIFVDDTLSALQQMARRHVSSFKSLVRIGITGSSGKTTTKECVVSILSGKGKVVYNPGNLNSDIGLPLSVMAVSHEDEYAVFEMGMNRPGEMDILSEILKPEYVIITNIGTAHIGLLGSRDAIAEEKRKALRYVKESRRAVLWEDDDYLDFLTQVLPGDPSLYGLSSMPGLNNIEPRGLDGSLLTYEDVEIHFPLPGSYNVLNAMSAIRLGEVIGVSPDLFKKGLERVSPLFGRGEVIKGKVVILSDCYNANLESMTASISFFASLEGAGIRHYVLASMKELGGQTEKAHKELGSFIHAHVKTEPVYLFGEEMKSAYKVLRKTQNVFWTETYEELEKRLVESLGIGDHILLKGSRSMELERLIGTIQHTLGEKAVC